MARSNYTPEQLIATAPTDIRDIPACAAWFADCMRWADIEREEDIKTDAWKVLKDLDSLCARQTAVDVLLGKLRAYIKITLTEQPVPFDPTPTEPSTNPSDPAAIPEPTYEKAVHSFDPGFPGYAAKASDPDYNNMPDLPA